MSIPSAWPQTLDFFGTPLVIEASPGQLTSDAGLLPLRQFDERIGLTRAFADALDDPRDPALVEHTLLEMVRARPRAPPALRRARRLLHFLLGLPCGHGLARRRLSEPFQPRSFFRKGADLMFNLVPWRRNRPQGRSLASPRQHPLAQMWEDFDALFDRYLNQWPALWDDDSGQARLWDFDVNETENEVVVRAELPGFDPEDLDVQVRDNTLRIQAEKRQEGRTGEGDGAREQRSSTYLRTMTLPAGINADQVTATYRNGVLELHMPRPAESKSKRIAIGGPEKTAEPAAATAGAGEAHGRGNGSKRQAQSEAAEGPAKAARKR